MPSIVGHCPLDYFQAMRSLGGRVGWTTIGIAIATGLLLRQTLAAADRPADTMRDLRDQFAACFHPPRETAGSRPTFYFSLDTRGQVVARPRTVLFGFKGTEADKRRFASSLESSFEHCLPLKMSKPLAASIPGKVYFLQYVTAASGETKEVLFRPFGSHGGGGGGYVVPPGGLDPEPLEPPTPVVPPVRISPMPAWLVRPPVRPLFPQRRIFLPLRPLHRFR